MKNALVLCAALALAPACGKGGGSTPKVCRDFVAAIQKLSNCSKLPEASRKEMKVQADKMNQAFELIDALSADEAKEQIKEMEDSCTEQLASIQDAVAECK